MGDIANKNLKIPKLFFKQTIYFEAILYNARNIILNPTKKSRDFFNSWIYTQFYSKTKFNYISSIIAIFNLSTRKALAFNPDYIKIFQFQSKIIVINLFAAKNRYISSKKCIHAITNSAKSRFWLVRYENCISAAL